MTRFVNAERFPLRPKIRNKDKTRGGSYLVMAKLATPGLDPGPSR